MDEYAMTMEIAVVGAGGYSKVIQDMIRSSSDYKIKAILDDKYNELIVENDVYVGPISSAQTLAEIIDQMKFVIAIGNNELRKQVISMLGFNDESYISLKHESAVISPSAFLGPGTVVMPNAVINADAKIGKHSIINTGAIIEHDSTIGNYVHVAPKATLTGTVRAEEGSMICAGATIIPGVYIGEWAIIGAGATVIRDIPPHSTAVGTPAKVIKEADEAE